MRGQLKRLEAILRKQAQFYRDASNDPHGINTAIYVMHLDLASAIRKTLTNPRKVKASRKS